VKQLIYTSAATCNFPAEDLRTLVTKARIRNAVYSVSGFLLFHTGSFIQVLEGSEQNVDLIWNSVARDPRHVCTLIGESSIADHEFHDSPMAFVNTALSNTQPSDIVDYFQLQPLIQLDARKAQQYLRFFYKDLNCDK